MTALKKKTKYLSEKTWLRKNSKKKQNFAKKTKSFFAKSFEMMEATTKNLEALGCLVHSTKMAQSEHIATVWMELFTCPIDCPGSLSTCETIHLRFSKQQIVDELQKSAILEYFHQDGIFTEFLRLAHEHKWNCEPKVYAILSHIGKYLWPEKWNREREEQDPFALSNY